MTKKHISEIMEQSPEGLVLPDGHIFPWDSIDYSPKGGYWQRTEVQKLTSFFRCCDSPPTAVLCYILENKDSNNLVRGSIRKIAKECEVSVFTVNRLFKTLYDANHLTKVQNGLYMISPSVLSYAGQTFQKLKSKYSKVANN